MSLSERERSNWYKITLAAYNDRNQARQKKNVKKLKAQKVTEPIKNLFETHILKIHIFFSLLKDVVGGGGSFVLTFIRIKMKASNGYFLLNFQEFITKKHAARKRNHKKVLSNQAATKILNETRQQPGRPMIYIQHT